MKNTTFLISGYFRPFCSLTRQKKIKSLNANCVMLYRIRISRINANTTFE